MASQFWDEETDRSERNKILRLVFQEFTVDGGHVVFREAARRVPALLPVRLRTWGEERERRDSNPRFTPTIAIRPPLNG